MACLPSCAVFDAERALLHLVGNFAELRRKKTVIQFVQGDDLVVAPRGQEYFFAASANVSEFVAGVHVSPFPDFPIVVE